MTKTLQKIQQAIKHGYYMENGNLFGPKGRIKICIYENTRYPTFSFNRGGVYGIPMHHFAAVYYYGIDAVEKAECIRHLDGNVLNLSQKNIVLGTRKENELDKDPAVRQRSAQQARSAQPYSPPNTILKADKVFTMLQQGYSKADIAREFKVSKTAVTNFIKRRNDESFAV